MAEVNYLKQSRWKFSVFLNHNRVLNRFCKFCITGNIKETDIIMAVEPKCLRFCMYVCILYMYKKLLFIAIK